MSLGGWGGGLKVSPPPYKIYKSYPSQNFRKKWHFALKNDIKKKKI
jgi:hypothetical protein